MRVIIEKRIVHGAWHLMNFFVCQIIGFSLRLAFERELSDLKDLVHPDSLCEIEADGKPGSIDVELELLEILDDEVIRVLQDSIRKIIKCRDVLIMLNNIDLDGVLRDRYASDLARDICASSCYVPEDTEDYKSLVANSIFVYSDFSYQIYWCATMLLKGSTQVCGEKTGDEFLEHIFEIQEGKYVMGDKNADLLLDLIADLQEDNMTIN